MTTSEERKKILGMIEEGKITAEEGARLLAALGKHDQRGATAIGEEAHWMRVQVTDLHSGKVKINVNVPVGLVNVGLRLASRFAPDMEDSEIVEILDAFRQGITGKLMEMIDEEEGQLVEVYFE